MTTLIGNLMFMRGGSLSLGVYFAVVRVSYYTVIFLLVFL